MILCGTSQAADIWRPVPFAPRYEVSNHGQIRKRINITHPERRQYAPIKPFFDKDGYLRVGLSGKKIHVHRIVYATFQGSLTDGLVVCHLDGDRRNNVPENLYQCTQKENISHKIGHGTWQAGESHPKAKHTNAQALAVRDALKDAHRNKEGRLVRGQALNIASSLNVPVTLVRAISRKRSGYALHTGV